MNEDKLGPIVNAGHRAQMELEQTEGAFESLRRDYIAAWEATNLRDNDGRERLWQAVQILGKVETHLKTVIANGKVAQRDIDRLRSGKTGIFS